MMPSAIRYDLVEVPFVQHVSTGPPHTCAVPLSNTNLLPCYGVRRPPVAGTAVACACAEQSGCLSASADMSCWQQVSTVHAHAWPVHHRAAGPDSSISFAWANLSPGSRSALRMHMPAQSLRMACARQHVVHTWEPCKPGQILHLHGACKACDCT